jgi:paired small multidrug resistance pump
MYDLLGIVGVVLILVTYVQLQRGRLQPEDWRYSLFNLVGSSLILFSLFFDWNLSAALIEGAWAIISFYGLVRHRPRRAGAS